MALTGVTAFIVFALTAVTVGTIISLFITPISLPLLLARAPRQTMYALAEEITGEQTDSYFDVSFTLSYGTLLPVYGFAYVTISLPYAWFVYFSLEYPVYWLAAFPALMTGITVAALGAFARSKELEWTVTPRLRDRVALSLYILFVTLLVGGISYFAGLEALTFFDSLSLPFV